jgi:hypothetical protein
MDLFLLLRYYLQGPKEVNVTGFGAMVQGEDKMGSVPNATKLRAPEGPKAATVAQRHREGSGRHSLGFEEASRQHERISVSLCLSGNSSLRLG